MRLVIIKQNSGATIGGLEVRQVVLMHSFDGISE